MVKQDPEKDLTRFMDKVNLDENDFEKKGTRSSKLSSAPSSDRADRATTEQVLDPRTRKIIFRMINRGIFDEFRGCLSTGKEANVYRAVLESGTQLAVKVYKTSILVFKDRDRYVSGEFRFKFGYSRHNPRKMVKLWAEKETRNLKRIYKSGIPVPKPLHLHMHALVMEFLGSEDGYPSPKLKDADIEPGKYQGLYHHLLAYMRILYQQCRLVHADLSEYNILYHQEKLYIIDVSQSVEHDHPLSLEFLRMDIKNVNAYFVRQGVVPFSERFIFTFIVTPATADEPYPESVEYVVSKLESMPKEELSEEQANDDAVFRSMYIPKTLNEVYDVDRDVQVVKEGKGDQLVYNDLLTIQPSKDNDSQSSDYSESESESESDGDGEDDGLTNVWDEAWEKSTQTERKFEDREYNKERKKKVKAENKEKRSHKMKKKDKRRLVANSKTKGKPKK